MNKKAASGKKSKRSNRSDLNKLITIHAGVHAWIVIHSPKVWAGADPKLRQLAIDGLMVAYDVLREIDRQAAVSVALAGSKSK